MGPVRQYTIQRTVRTAHLSVLMTVHTQWWMVDQQLRVSDLPPDVSLTDWASCPQQVTLVMMRPVVSTAQSMTYTIQHRTVLIISPLTSRQPQMSSMGGNGENDGQ